MIKYVLILLSLFLMNVFAFGSIPGIDIEDDKLAHFATGALIAKYCHDDYKMDVVAGTSTVLAFSLLKEYIDIQSGGYADENDVKAALIGVMCVYVWEDNIKLRINENGFSFRFQF